MLQLFRKTQVPFYINAFNLPSSYTGLHKFGNHEWGFILNNPASRVKAPKTTKKEACYFKVEQTEYILFLIEKEPIKYKPMITLSIYGGMREGDLNALTWSDIDFTNGIITINKSLQHLAGEGTSIKSTKTENTRVISVPAAVIDLLKEYKKWQNEERFKLGNLWKDSDNIFTARDGGFIYPSPISKWFLKFIRRTNEDIKNVFTIKADDKHLYLLPEVNFHGLRHTSAALLINQGVDISTVSKRLGHARASTTMDIYSHSLLKAETEASTKLDNLFNKKVQNTKQG
jgi:integrase